MREARRRVRAVVIVIAEVAKSVADVGGIAGGVAMRRVDGVASAMLLPRLRLSLREKLRARRRRCLRSFMLSRVG